MVGRDALEDRKDCAYLQRRVIGDGLVVLTIMVGRNSDVRTRLTGDGIAQRT